MGKEQSIDILIQAAQKEALQTIGLMENIVETLGWQLDYSALVLDELDKKLIDAKQEEE